MPKNRKCPIIISVIILLFFVHLCMSSQASASDKNTSKVPQQEGVIKNIIPLKDKKVGYLGILPLPKNYPLGYFPNKYVFTGEIYTKQSDIPAHSSNIFVPVDYERIIESTLIAVMRFENVFITQYSSIDAAKNDGVSYLLLITPHIFHVESESKALIKLCFTIIDISSREIVYEGLCSKEIKRKDIPSTVKQNLIITLGTHGYNFQPQRALLAEGVYRCVMDFITSASCENSGELKNAKNK